jgi:hypothetical protein
VSTNKRAVVPSTSTGTVRRFVTRVKARISAADGRASCFDEDEEQAQTTRNGRSARVRRLIMKGGSLVRRSAARVADRYSGSHFSTKVSERGRCPTSKKVREQGAKGEEEKAAGIFNKFRLSSSPSLPVSFLFMTDNHAR